MSIMVNHSSLNISSARVIMSGWVVALVLFASVSYADPVLYTDDTVPAANISIGADGVEFQLSAAKTYAYTMSGSGAFYKTGAGTLTLNKNGSTFTGDVHLDGGKIKVTAAWTGNKSALGAVNISRTVYVNSGTELIFNNQNIFNNAHNDNPVAIVADGGKISNEGAYYNFLQYLTLKNGANLHAADGNTTWEAYKLQNLNIVSNSDGSAATAPTITGANNNHAVISFGAKSDEVATKPSTIYVENITNNANSDLIISAKIVDSTTVNTGVRTPGEIIKTGAGTLELKNINSSYSGNLTIKEGTLKVTAGSNADNRTASALGASNVEGRTVTINSGAVLELAAQDVMCDTHADTKLLFVVDGGKITNSGANFNFIQNVTLKNGANMHAANGNTSWEAYKIQNLRVERSGDAAASAVSLTGANNDHAVFSFGAISNNITTVPVSIYVEDITSANGASDAATDLLISAKIVDANIDGKTKKPAPMVKSGAGTLQLTNTGNTYSGNLTIDEGTVKVTAGSASNGRTASALGAGNVAGRLVTVNEGAVLDLTVDNVIVNAHTDTKLAIVVDGGQIINSGYNYLQNLTLKDGAQVYAANGAEVWKSYKFHNLNVVRKSADAADSPVVISSDLSKPYATIAFGAKSDTIKVGDNNSISTVTVEEITSADPSVNDNVSDLVISAIIANPLHTTSGALSNATQIVKAGAGTMELTAANTITGKTTISEGSLKLSGAGTLGTGEVINNSTLELAYSSDKTFSNTVSGTGDLIKTGNGTLTLSSRDSSFTGDIYIDEGKIKVSVQRNGSNSAFGKVQEGRSIYVNSGAELIFNNQDLFNDAHNIEPVVLVADGGKISNEGAYYNFLQHVTLKDGGNLYASDGHTAWEAYKLQYVNVLRNDDGSAADAATITSSGQDHAVISFGSITSNVSTDPSTVYVEDITSASADSVDNLSDLVISARIVDPTISRSGTVGNKTASEVFKTGAGTLELTAANPITGKTTISEGSIKLTSNGTLGTGEIINNSNLEFAHESDQSFTNAISGTGAVTKTGSGTLTLSGADTHTGETTVSAGTLKLTGNAISALVNKTAGVTTVEPDGTLEFNVNTRVAPVRMTVSDANKIVSTGEIIKTGNGTLQLYEASNGAIDIRSLTVSSGRMDILGSVTGGITVEPDTVFSPGASNSSSAADVPAVVGHRGNSSVAPENTLSAFRSCVESGAQGAECDVYRTKDGYLVLQHDSTLQRNVRDADGNPVTGRIADYTLDELLTMDFGVWKGEEFRGEKVATLDQYLDLLNGTSCAPVIELKQTGLEADTIAAVRERGMEDETTIIAFSEAAIKECRRLAPEIKAAWLCTKNSSETVDQYADRIIATLQELDTTYVDLESSPVTPELVQKLHDNGITVMTWTVDNPDRVSELYNMGIDSVTTNVPVTGIELLDYATGSIAFADNPVGEASFGDVFTLKAGATLLLEQDETGMDKLTASSFDIDSDSIIELIMGSYEPGAEYPIIVNSSPEGFDDEMATDDFWNDLLSPESDLYWDLFVRGNTVYASIYGDVPDSGSGVPEPSTWALLALGVAGLLYFRKRTCK